MKLALAKGCTKLILQFDSGSALSYLKKGSIPWPTKNMIQRIQGMVRIFQSFIVVHVYTEK